MIKREEQTCVLPEDSLWDRKGLIEKSRMKGLRTLSDEEDWE